MVKKPKITDALDEKKMKNKAMEEKRLLKEDIKQQKLLESLKKRRIKRKGLPEEYLDYPESMSANPIINLVNFKKNDDVETYKKVRHILKEGNSFQKILDELSFILDCDRSEICLIYEHVISKNDTSNIVYFYNSYNPDFNELLKTESCKAVFNGVIKAWHIPSEDAGKSEIIDGVSSFYKVVIDLNNLIIMINDYSPSQSLKTGVAFYYMPFHISIEKKEVFEAIHSYRPSDYFLSNSLYLHDGEKFIPFPDEDIIWTRSPFLLLRYSVAGGQPRYGSFSTIGKSMETVVFGNDPKSTGKAIGRFMGACRSMKSPALTDGYSEIFPISEPLIKDLQGNFERFSESIEIIKNTLPDLSFSLLCSDYVTLMSDKHGADSNAIIAYVTTESNKNKNYLKKIYSFFGEGESEYPIIFTRSIIDGWDEKEDNHFLVTMAHELAHYLVMDEPGEFPHEDYFGHGIAWAVCHDLLEYLFIEDYSGTEYKDYHPQDIETILQIQDIVGTVGLESIDRIRQKRSLSKLDIKEVTKKCVSNLSECFERITLKNLTKPKNDVTIHKE